MDNKLISYTLYELDKFVKELRSSLIRPIVVVPGTFRVLHPGHLWLFQRARDEAGISGHIIALVNSHGSIMAIKPKAEYIMHDEHRKVMALKAGADHVYMFDEKTPTEICKRIKPDILVKGGDWKREDLPEARYCKKTVIVKRIHLGNAEDILERVGVLNGR